MSPFGHSCCHRPCIRYMSGKNLKNQSSTRSSHQRLNIKIIRLVRLKILRFRRPFWFIRSFDIMSRARRDSQKLESQIEETIEHHIIADRQARAETSSYYFLFLLLLHHYHHISSHLDSTPLLPLDSVMGHTAISQRYNTVYRKAGIVAVVDNPNIEPSSSQPQNRTIFTP